MPLRLFDMRDIVSTRLMFVKAVLFAVTVILSGGVLFAVAPQLSTIVLLGVFGWACARTYYFVFYVIERYVDPTFKFSGIASALRFIWVISTGSRGV